MLPTNMNPPASITRRTVLQAATACAACACCATLPSCNESLGTGRRPKAFDAGPVDKFKNDDIYDEFAKKPRLLVIRKMDKIVVASSKCTHRDCVVAKKDGGLFCPCHGSRFDNAGTILKGPATKSLPRYRVSVVNNRLIVDLTKQFNERDWDKDGAFVVVI